MNYKNNDDIFRTNILFTNDIIFNEMKTIRFHLIHSITSNIDVSVNLYNRQTIGESNSNPFYDAGKLFNIIRINNSIKLLEEDELYKITSTFKSTMNKSSKFCSLSEKIIEPIDHMIYFTKYMFIPARLDVNTIPKTTQKTLFSNWLSVIIILLFREGYIDKFSAIPYTDVYKNCVKTLLVNEKVVLALRNIEVAGIESCLTKVPEKDLHKFLIIMNKFIFLINAEIVTKICPNYPICAHANPKFDGSWLSPLDEDVNKQLFELRKLAN